jgi:uncharacterized repeat protein (TIGR03803 family)
MRRLTLLALLPAFVFCLFSMSSSVAAGQSLTVSTLHNFCTTQNCPDGQQPTGSLVQAYDGDFYGLTAVGGAYGRGSIFRITPAGVLTTLYSFCSAASQTCADGSIPVAIMQAGDGNLYGTTALGGANSSGTLFRFVLSSNGGAFTTLYTSCSAGGAQCSDGGQPFSLIQGSNGLLYGVTQSFGGAFGSSDEGGTLFEFTPSGDSGTMTILNRFCSATDCTDGSIPKGILEGSDKNFYGAFTQGGYSARFGASGVGGVFKLLSPALTYTIIYNFCATVNGKGQCIDGGFPYANIIETQDGSLYGTISSTPSVATGVIYRLTTAGTYTAMYTFAGTTDGSDPQQPFTYATDGNYYGSTELGGDGDGTFFNFSVANTLATLDTYFTPANADSAPAGAAGPILQGSDGDFYGVTEIGGTGSGFNGDGGGTVYKVSPTPALPPPVALTVSPSSTAINSSVTLSWTVVNAFSLTNQQCYAFVQNKATGAGTWTGLQSVTYDSKTMTYGGSAKVTPTSTGKFTYALTCGGVESGFATLDVGKSSATALTVTPNPASVGQSATLKATVSATSSPTPTGSVTFSAAGVALATVNINGSGIATLTASTNGEPPAVYPITASYSGDSTYISSASTAVNVTLNKAPTTTAFSASPTSVTPPGSVTLTATVARSATGATGIPTGSVTFSTEGITLATVKLNSKGVAAITASSNGYPAGNYPITAKYSGDSSDSASASSAVTVTVK